MRALLLLACATFALADEPKPDPATVHLPADAILVVRLAPPERIDAIGADLPVLRELMEERRPLGDLVLEDILSEELADRSKPVYFAVGADGETTTLVRARPGVTAEQVEALDAGNAPWNCRLMADGWIREAKQARPAGAAEPFSLLPGDLSVTLPVGRLVEKHRAKIAEAFANLGKLDEMAEEQGVPVPPGVLRLVRLLGGKVLRAVADVEDVHYALTWRGQRLESEGWIRTREGSGLRGWLEARKGGKPNGLIDLFPERAFYMVESAGTTAALDADVAALLDEAFGEGGRSLLLLLSPSYALHEHLTGQAAGAIMVHGMMTMGMRSVHEVKPGADLGAAIAALDATKLNGMLGGLVEVKLERGFSKAGETAMHRLTYMSALPQAAMFVGQMTTCFAVEGNYLLVAQSAAAENELRALLARIRSGERATHPHTTAMERLMPDRQEGLSINLGTLKPLVGLAALASPEVAQALNAMPDDLWLSTALAVRGGNVHVRGDWPVKECLEYAAKVKALR